LVPAVNKGENGFVAEVDSRYIKFYAGKTQSRWHPTGRNVEYDPTWGVEDLYDIVAETLDRLARNNHGSVWAMAYCRADGQNVYIARVRVVADREEEEEEESKGKPDNIGETYKVAFDTLLGVVSHYKQTTEDALTMAARALRGSVEVSYKLGATESALKLGNNEASTAALIDAGERALPAVLSVAEKIGLAVAGKKEVSKPPPKVDIQAPRPEGGEARVSWDIAAIESLGLDIVGVVGADKAALTAEHKARLAGMLAAMQGALA